MGRYSDHGRSPGKKRLCFRNRRCGNAGIGEFLELDLVVGQFLFIVNNRKHILLAHVPGGNDFFDQLGKPDRVTLREDADKVERLSCARFFTAPEDPVIMGAGLDDIPALAQVAVHEKTAQEIALVGILGEQRIESIARDLNLLAVEEIQGFLRRKPYPFPLRTPVPALVVQRPPVPAGEHRSAVKYRLHVKKL